MDDEKDILNGIIDGSSWQAKVVQRAPYEIVVLAENRR